MPEMLKTKLITCSFHFKMSEPSPFLKTQQIRQCFRITGQDFVLLGDFHDFDL